MNRKTLRQTVRNRRKLQLDWLLPLEDRCLLSTYRVVNTNDSGPGSLRQAILDANAHSGPDTVLFEMPASTAPGLDIPITGFDPTTQMWTIVPVTPLPAITDPLTIDGYSQAQFPVPYVYQSVKNDIQQIALSGIVTGGTFTIDYVYTVNGGGLLSVSTSPIPYNATAAQVQAALEALDPFLAGNVPLSGNIHVTGGPLPSSPISVEFINQLGNQFIPLMLPGTSTDLIGTSFPHVVTSHLQFGSDQASPPIEISSSVNASAATTGNTAIPRVIIDGSQTGGATGFDIRASNSSLRGLIITGFGIGVSVPSPNSTGVRIQGNYIGGYARYPVDPQTGLPPSTGQTVEWVSSGNSLQGIVLGSTNAIIGGSNPQESNVITNNGLQGISVLAGAQGNVIAGNQIGIAGPNSSGRYVVAGNGAEGVLIASSSNTVGGSGGSGNLISGNELDGIRVVGPGATQNLITGNFIGTGPGGGFLFGSGDPGNHGDGIRIENAPDNRVGGSATGQGNVISGNGGAGIRVSGPMATRTGIAGNIIGLTSDGGAGLGNDQEGVFIDSSSNTVGPGNVISSNLRGILLTGVAATGNTILDNLIGTDRRGNLDLGNTFEGIRIDNAPGNLVSGSAPGKQVISGNNQGIVIIGSNATGNTVRGSYIGADATGLIPIANSQQGILIDNAPDNLIGGTDSGAGNLILGNHWGVVIQNAGATGNMLQANTIIQSEAEAVVVQGLASYNRIGDLATSAGNTIRLNSGDGIHLVSGSSNAILSNSISDNGGLGIHLDPGANNNQTAPVLVSVTSDGTRTVIVGTLSTQPNAIYTIQFFANPAGSSHDEGETLIGSSIVRTDGSGLAGFNTTLFTGLSVGQIVTATATRFNDQAAPLDSSAFSASRPVGALIAGGTFLVTSTADSGAGSLRQAIIDANSTPGQDTIAFAIPGTGERVIRLASPLPSITDPVIIDGLTQPGSAPNVSADDRPAQGDIAVLLVRIDGTLAGSGANGLVVNAPNVLIGGLSITGFAGAGIDLEPKAIGCTIYDTFLGTQSQSDVAFNASPLDPLSNPLANGVGILVRGSNNRIGGTTPASRNLIQGNRQYGVLVEGPGGTGNLIEGNLILDNGIDGIRITTSNNFVGEAIGAGPDGGGNVISGNRGNGITITELGALAGSLPNNNIIWNNEIGTDVRLPNLAGQPPFRGTTARPNGGAGILIDGALRNIIGGTVANARNVIAGNAGDGIVIQNDPTVGGTQVSSETVVAANDIGFNIVSGLVYLLPNRSGIRIVDSSGNVIGGSTESARNRIAANLNHGIEISGPGASGNVVAGNFIGTILGGDDYGNTFDGVHIEMAPGNRIGGTTSGERNVISGNNTGVAIIGAGSTGNTVLGNDIGTRSDGLTDLGNAVDGVLIQDASGNTIGGPTSGSRNVISGNNTGIHLTGLYATGNQVIGNAIGTDATGTVPLSNAIDGILVTGQASNNVIGGNGATLGNLILFNGADGIHVQSGSNGIVILSNSISDNGGLGIRLDPDVNEGIVAPKLRLASSFTSWTVFTGCFTGYENRMYRIQFFSNISPDSSGFGEGRTLLGAANVTTDATGHATFNVTITSSVPEGQFVSATATLLDTSNPPKPVASSAFSKAQEVDSFSTTVTTTDDNGSDARPLPGSLRSAILHANAHTGLDVIDFAIPSDDNGFDISTLTWRLQVVSDLPPINDATTIDGYTQQAVAVVNGVVVRVTAVPNTSVTGNDAKLRVILDGGQTVNVGLQINQQSTVRGLIFDRFVDAGIRIDSPDDSHDGSNSVVQGNFFGVHVEYQLDPFTNQSIPVVRGSGNAGSGIAIGANAKQILIGGTDPAARNTFAGNSGPGVELEAGADGMLVQGNLFGIVAAGTNTLRVVGNGLAGIQVGSAGNLIGGTASGARNVLAGNGVGVLIQGATALGNLVQGNLIGTALSGLAAFGQGQVGNTNAGVRIDNAPNNTIGGTTPAAQNIISGNLGDGVIISGPGATGNRLIGNRIGLDAIGNPLGNRNGVRITGGASNNQVGGLGTNDGNLIASNLGVRSDPNTGFGVWVESGTGNAILSNVITGNGGPGINLSPGANHDQPAPALTSVGSDNSRTVISGTLLAPANGFYTIQFFANSASDLGMAEGESLIGSTTVRTDASGQATFSLNLLVGLTLGQFVTATATALNAQSQPSDSSMFSTPTIVGPIQAAGTIFVTNTNDSGAGSFRQAILEANAKSPSPTRIAFFIPGAGLHTILPLTPLPTITNTVYIDGYSQRVIDPNGQPNSVPFTLDSPNATPNMVLLIEIRGILLPTGQPSQDGLVFDPPDDGQHTTANSVVAGLMISDFPGSGIVLADQTASATGSIGISILGSIIQNNGTGITIRSSNNRVGQPQATGLPSPADGNLIQGNRVGILIEKPTGTAGTDEATGNRIEDNVLFGNQNSSTHDGAGIVIRTSNNSVTGNAITFNDRGIVIEDTSLSTGSAFGQGNEIVGNRIGDLDSAGYPTRGNLREGVLISNSPGNRLIGNVIIANGADASAPEWQRAGIRVTVDPTRPEGQAALVNNIPNRIQGNLIGTGATSTPLFTGNYNGIWVEADNVAIGGSTTGTGNVISANQRAGVVYSNRVLSSFAFNTLQGNLIGLDAGGTQDFGNTFDGVLIDNVKGVTIGPNNTISGNNWGVTIRGSGATGNTVTGNRIGTNAAGNADVGNAADGVRILAGASSNTIGPGNVISGNNRGIRLDSASRNTIKGNFIGTDSSGSQLLGNDVDGILIVNNASNNTIGGGATDLGNTIANNVGNGVLVQSGIGNAILTNSIFNNGLSGILLPAGSTPPGPNNLIAPPTLQVFASGSQATVQGTYHGAPNSTYTIQVFLNPSLGPSGRAQGQTYLATTSVTTNGSGDGTFKIDFSKGLPAGQFVTGTATDGLGDTSEFSQAALVVNSLVQFAASSLAVPETAGAVSIKVTRTGTTEAGSVDYAVAGGTAINGVNYQLTPGTLTFAKGQATQTLTLTVLRDGLQSGDKTVDLVLNHGTNVGIGTPDHMIVTIQDVDSPGQVAFGASSYDVSERAGSVKVYVVRTGGLSGPLSVDYQTMNGTAIAGVDYLPRSGTLTFPDGVANATAVIEVPIIDNGALDGERNFTVSLSGSHVGTPSTVTVTIHDDDLELTPPVVTGLIPVVGSKGITGITVGYSKPMDPARSTQLFNYDNVITAAGRDGVFGTADDVKTRIVSATYDPATFQVLLTPVTPLPINGIYQIRINRVVVPVVGPGVADAFGNLLDGENDGRAGGAFVGYIGLGTRLSYRDRDGDQVSLTLSGGGTMMVTLGSDGEARSLQLSGTVSGKSSLSGSIKKIGRSRGQTSIPVVTGASGVQIKLNRTIFLVDSSLPSAPTAPSSPSSPRTRTVSNQAVPALINRTIGASIASRYVSWR